jgi:hypothetical protein
VYATCLFCHRDLGRNEAIEEFPIGRRLAFDAAKGRLWVICPACQRWNLTPIEERWEAVESCERLFRGQRLRSQTDNIGLTRIPEGTELIRIGSPLRPEFAAWRYGAVFRRRLQRRVAMVTSVGAGVGVAGLALLGAPAIAAAAPLAVVPLAHLGMIAVFARDHFGGASVAGASGKRLRVTLANLNHSRLELTANGELSLSLQHASGRELLNGERASRAVSTLLAHVNKAGAAQQTVREASEMIATAGDPEHAIAAVAREIADRTHQYDLLSADKRQSLRARTIGEAMKSQMEFQERLRERLGFWTVNGAELVYQGALHRLPRVQRLALEMSLHEASEQHALDEELESLERAWREAEEIAAIADGLLTPKAIEERLNK